MSGSGSVICMTFHELILANINELECFDTKDIFTDNVLYYDQLNKMGQGH